VEGKEEKHHSSDEDDEDDDASATGETDLIDDCFSARLCSLLTLL
jgi:hypothetical protein